MTQDFLVKLAPDMGNQVRVEINAPLAAIPAAGQTFLRPLLALDPNEVKQMRQGAPPPVLVQQISDKLRQWLIDGDLNILLSTALGQSAESWRLIFNADPRLLGALADIPLELLEHNAAPLALNPRVSALVHLLPKAPLATQPTANDWPLRILLVRSNPQDLGGAVPPGAPLCDYVLGLRPHGVTAAQSGKLVEIDLLSREPGAAGLPTWEAMREQLLRKSYHLLVYLGHGDLIETFGGLEPLGALLMENAAGDAHEAISSLQLRVELQNHPAPVVLLAGCLTAAELPAEIKEAVDEETPRWVRGAQGVAQALVNSQAGVLLAVGMRYRLETAAAMRFLRSFFRCLLELAPGDVEAAVRKGREDLHADSPFPPNWSAPMLFRAPGQEPMFDFLRRLPESAPEPEEEQHQQYRQIIWNGLVKQPLSTRTDVALQPLHLVLQEAEQKLLQRALAKGALLIPGRVETGPEQTVTLPVYLHGQLPVDRLEGQIVVRSDEARVLSVQRTESTKQHGYQVLSNVEGNTAQFLIQRQAGVVAGPAATTVAANHAALPEGLLFEVTVMVGGNFPAVYPVVVDMVATQPLRSVRGLNNALLVSPP
jgi:hypothetical protein